jgi:taurine---2-oxoglutarate transaminase
MILRPDRGPTAGESSAGAFDGHDGGWVKSVHRDYVIKSWSVQSSAEPMLVAGAEGCWFWDETGKRYLDFESQLVNLNLGHQHPGLIAAIKKQADQLCYVGPGMANPQRSQLAAELAEIAPGDLRRTFFTNGGAEATENAVKLARHYTGRPKVITRYRSYHGATAGAISMSGDPRRWWAEPGTPGIVRMFDPYRYRCPAGHPDPCPVCTGAPHLEELLAYEDPTSVAAVVLETVTGTNGIIVPPDGYLAAVREVCDRHGILLILDEIMVGFGRTGRWFACQHWDVTPDILCVAKGINSGYVPLGAMIISDRFDEWLRTNTFPGGLTYSGHPLACATGVASIAIMREERLVERAAARGAELGQLLHDLAARHPSIGDVRGLGLFWGLELVRSRRSKEPLVPFNAGGADAKPIAAVLKAALERGLYLSAYSNVIRLAPPLIVTKDELELAVSILDEVLAIADEHCLDGSLA